LLFKEKEDKKINPLKSFARAIFKKIYLLIESFFGMSGQHTLSLPSTFEKKRQFLKSNAQINKIFPQKRRNIWLV
jgi:hypothetical protein